MSAVVFVLESSRGQQVGVLGRGAAPVDPTEDRGVLCLGLPRLGDGWEPRRRALRFNLQDSKFKLSH